MAKSERALSADTSSRVIALTGASGFLGGSILRALVERQWRVRALVRRDPPQADGLAGVEWVRGALEDRASLDRLTESADAVIHCAALVKARHVREFIDANVKGTALFAQSAQRAGVRRFVHVSSLAARAPWLSAYAATKAAAEAEVARVLAPDVWTVLRPTTIYGPGDREIIKLAQLAQKGVVLGFGGAAQVLSFIHVADATNACLAALEAPRAAGQVIEIDDGVGGYNWGQIRDILAKALGVNVRIVPIPGWFLHLAAFLNQTGGRLLGGAPIFTLGKAREMRHPNWEVCAGRAVQLLDWRPTIPFSRGAESLISERP